MKPDEIIREGRELCEKATPGPWEPFCRHCGHDNDDPEWEGEFLAWEVNGPVPARGRGDYERGWDAHFIAKSRMLLPAALDALEEARKRPPLCKFGYEVTPKGCVVCSEMPNANCAGRIASRWASNAEAALAKAEAERDEARTERDRLEVLNRDERGAWSKAWSIMTGGKDWMGAHTDEEIVQSARVLMEDRDLARRNWMLEIARQHVACAAQVVPWARYEATQRFGKDEAERLFPKEGE